MKPRDRLFLFCCGGFLYYLIETMWKGSSHWSMFLAGGCCFRLIGIIRTSFERLGTAAKCALGSCAITGVEFLSGVIVNKLMGLNVWDYSSLPFNILGQICLPFSVLWYFISYAALYTDRFLCTEILDTEYEPLAA